MWCETIMHWIFYICGGYMWLMTWLEVLIMRKHQTHDLWEKICDLISIVGVWAFLMWRFV